MFIGVIYVKINRMKATIGSKDVKKYFLSKGLVHAPRFLEL